MVVPPLCKVMDRKLNYKKLAPEPFVAQTALEHAINTTSGFEPTLLEFVRLRASQMNGCHFCIAMHTLELQKHHETADRISQLTDWRNTAIYTQRERAALAWAEAVTNIQDGHAPDAIFDQAREHFSEAEIVNLTWAIASINAWNRMAIAFQAEYKPEKL